jgi:uncharacterized protein DUF6941
LRLGTMMLANYAEDSNGLLYVQGGGWDTINVAAPIQNAPENVFAVVQGFLVIRLMFHPTETGREHRFSTDITDEDGGPVGHIEGGANIPRTPGLPPSWDQNVNLVVPLTGLGVPRPGLYNISLLVDGQHLGDQPFRVIKAY